MSDQNYKTSELGGIPLTDEKPGFEAHELAICAGCGKANGPDRINCIYCGAELVTTDRYVGSRKFALRKLEDWEPGINLIAFPTGEREATIDSAAGILGLDIDVLPDLLEKQTLLPLLRVENMEVADEVSSKLRDIGIEVCTIDDKEVDAGRPPTRIRAIELNAPTVTFVDFNTGQKYPITNSDVLLVVSGGIFESRREEVTKRKRGSMKVLDEFESASDQRVIDIYTSQNNVGFRINSNGFDFSVLGPEKDLFAARNMGRLQTLFSELFPNAVLADEYDSLRDVLNSVWPNVVSKDLHGLQVRGYGKREFGAKYSASNLTQFTQYSRMRRLLI